MKKAFVDTTVLVNALLKEGAEKRNAQNALRSFDETLLPVYAIKELKAGALFNFAWTHNKLVSTKSYDLTLAAIQKMATTPRRYLPATAIQALRDIGRSYKTMSLGDLPTRYGSVASLDGMLYDHARLSLKRRIAKAWKQRRTLTSKVVCELSCYDEGDIFFEGNEQLNLGPTACEKNKACCIAKQFTSSRDVAKLEKAIPSDAERAEDRRRKAALKLIRLGRPIENSDCRDLGDAVFALQCPPDAVILTTNVRDHEPLATALGKEVRAPKR